MATNSTIKDIGYTAPDQKEIDAYNAENRQASPVGVSQDQNFNNFVNWMKSGQPVKTDTTSPITPADLSNTKTINVKTGETTSPNTNNLSVYSDSAVNQAQMDIDEMKSKEQTPREKALASYEKLTTEAGKRAADTATLQKEQDVTGKTKAINEINKKILTRSAAYDKQLKELEKNPEGKLESGLNFERNALIKTRNEEIAQYTLEKALAQGDLDTANKIVETTIAAKYEPIEQQLNNYQKLITLYGDDMTESEKFEAQNKLDTAKETLDFQRQKELLDYKQRIDQSNAKYESDLKSGADKIGLEGFTAGTIKSLDDIRNAPVSTITKAVMSGQASVKDLTPTDKKQVLSEMYSTGFDSKNYLLNKVGALYDMYLAVPSTFKGVVKGRVPFAQDLNAEVKKFEALKNVLTREVARLNDVGMLSDQDVASYKESLPSRTSNSPQVVLKSIGGLSTALTGRKNNIGEVVEINGKRYMVGIDGDTLLDPVTGLEAE